MYHDHWTAADRASCDRCGSLRELADVAIGMLQRLQAQYPGKVIHQLCGPMTTGGLGSLDLNMLVFQRAIDVARQNGLVVFNQLPFQKAMMRLVDCSGRIGYPHALIDDFYYHVFWS